jgi:cytochrome c-type biogenesis protein CcmE
MTDVSDPIVVPTRRSTNRLRVFIALGAIIAALGFVVIRGLGEAAQFFRPVDQAIAKRSEIGTKRFSLIGVVVDGTVVESGRQVAFTVEQNGVQMKVRHTGVPPDLFKPGMPVVLDGHFDAVTGEPLFVSDRMAVKHSAEYKTENPDRVDASGV